MKYICHLLSSFCLLLFLFFMYLNLGTAGVDDYGATPAHAFAYGLLPLERSSGGNSEQVDSSLTIHLGVLGSNNLRAILTRDLPPGMSVGPPNTVPSWSGSLDSAALISRPIQSDVKAVDGDDLITLAIVLENRSLLDNKFFDIHLQAVAPPNLITTTVITGQNLQARNGIGEFMAIRSLDGGLFGDGIVLNAPDPGLSALAPYSDSTGTNIAVVTFDLAIAATTLPSDSLPVTARLVGYLFESNGTELQVQLPVELGQDTALITTSLPTLSSAIIATSQLHTSNLMTDAVPVTIGDIVTYEVVLEIPQGTSPEGFLKSEMDPGMGLVDVVSIEASANITTDMPDGFDGVIRSLRLINQSRPEPGQGQMFDLSFGTLTVRDDGAGSPGIIKVRYRGVLLNNAFNRQGQAELKRNNYLQWCWGSSHKVVTGNTPDVFIVEPTLNIRQALSPIDVTAHATVTISVTVSHSLDSTSSAFDVLVNNPLSMGLVPLPDTLKSLSPEQPPTELRLVEATPIAPPSIAAQWDSMPKGSSASFQFQAVVTDTFVAPSESPQDVLLPNTVDLTWSSVPGSNNQSLSIYNDLAAERTGNQIDIGGKFNDYRQSRTESFTLTVPATPPNKVSIESELTVTPSGTPVLPGDTLDYQLVVWNEGQLPAEGVAVTNLLDNSTTLESSSIKTNQGYISATSGQLTNRFSVEIGKLEFGQPVTLTYQAVVESPLEPGVTQIANQALISGDNFSLSTSDDPATPVIDDPTLTFTSMRPRLYAANSAKLTANWESSDGVVVQNAIEYEIDIFNHGFGQADNVVYHNLISQDAGLIVESVSTSQGAPVDSIQPGDHELWLDVGDVLPGQGVKIQFVVGVDDLVSGSETIVSHGIVQSDNAPALLTDDPVTGLTADPTAVVLGQSPWIVATKRVFLFDDIDNNGLPTGGDIVAHLISIRNMGSVSATHAVYSDTLPLWTSWVPDSLQVDRPGMTANVSNASSNSSVRQDGIMLDIGTLASYGTFGGSDSVHLSYLVKIDDTVPADGATLSSQGTVKADGIGAVKTSDPINMNSGRATLMILEASPHVRALKHDLLLKDADNDGLSPYDAQSDPDRLLYRIEVQNLGREPVSEVIIDDSLNEYVRLIPESVRTDRGTIIVGNTTDSGTVIVDMGPLPERQENGSIDGAVISFEIEMADVVAPAQIENAAEILFTRQGDSGNSADSLTVVTDDPDTPELLDPTVTHIFQVPTGLNQQAEPAPSALNRAVYLPITAR